LLKSFLDSSNAVTQIFVHRTSASRSAFTQVGSSIEDFVIK